MTGPVRDQVHEALAEHIRGQVIGSDDADYETARRCHNGMIDRRPLAIVRPLGAADVAAAVRIARGHGVEIGVRGGGHSPAGHGVREGGLLLDLALMRGVDVDPDARTARVQGGALWRDVYEEAAVHGLGMTGGTVSSTGVGGLTLGGGLGWLMGLHGLTVDHLLEAEVVLAGGEVVRARAGEHDDLFWALRGGGGNFGVVTSFVFRLHPVADVAGGIVVHPFEDVPAMLRRYREITAGAPDALGLFAALTHAPGDDAPAVGAIAMCHAGPAPEADRDLEPVASWGSPLIAEVGRMSFPEVNRLFEHEFPRGALNYWKSAFVQGVSDDLIELIVDRFASCPSPMTQIVLEHFHGAVTRVGPSETAVPHRSDGYNLFIASVWEDAGDSDANVAWTRETFADLEPYRADRRWFNYYDGDEGSDALAAAFGENAERLAQVKRRYDPDNVFHLNQNIAPAGVA